MSATADAPEAAAPADPGPTQWVYRGQTRASYGSIASCAWDCQRELVWMGDPFGFVTAFSPQRPVTEEVGWHTHASWRAFKDGVVAVDMLDPEKFRAGGATPVATEALIGAASATTVRLHKRGGATVFRKEVPASFQRRIQFMQCDAAHHRLVVAGETPGLLLLPIDAPVRDDPIVVAESSPTITSLRLRTHHLVCGLATGDTVLRDARSMDVVATLTGTGTRVYCADAWEPNHVVCSVVSNARGTSVVRVFDVRQPTTPFNSVILPGIVSTLQLFADPVTGRPCGLCILPHSFCMVDPAQHTPVFYSGEMDEATLVSAAVSVDGSCAVACNDSGVLHAFSASNCVARDDFHNTPALLDAPQPKPPTFRSAFREVQIDEGFDGSMPESELCSGWPPEDYMILSAPPKARQIPQNVLSNIRIGQIGHNVLGFTRGNVYASDPKDRLARVIPNPYPYNLQLGDDPVKAREKLKLVEKEARRSTTSRVKTNASGYYAKHEEAQQCCYASSGFEWKNCNASKDVIGLDNSLPESWVNALLQCMYHVHPPVYYVRRSLQYHVCRKRFCLACEIGTLFTNMQTQAIYRNDTPICQPWQLYRTMRQIPELIQAGVFDQPKSRDDAVDKCHRLQRLMLQIVDRDLRQGRDNRFKEQSPQLMPPENSITALFATDIVISKSSSMAQFFWDVPASATKVDEGLQHLLKKLECINGEAASIRALPPILVLLLNPEHGSLHPPQTLKFSRSQEEYNYTLNCKVIHLAEDVDDPGHFVNHIRANNDFYFIINDYYVSQAAKEEILESNIPAMTPHSTVVAYYAQQDYRGIRIGNKGEERLPTFDFCGPLIVDDPFAKEIQLHPPQVLAPLVRLSIMDDVAPGDIVALDAEYVVLEWGNKGDPSEPDYVRRQRKPNMTVARLSCILSKTPGDERTIVDDYVHTPEPVLDYVTQYSGIAPGDLDQQQSHYNLTALKAMYLKLRALLDRGVRFLGHGLAQDFRVLNIVVPQAQVIDTVELFHRKGGRKLALRFLAFHLLSERVQENEHDSIEDARTSLRLYRKYEELIREGTFEQTMDHLMMKGVETNWYVAEKQAPLSTPTVAAVALDAATASTVVALDGAVGQKSAE